MVDDRQPWNVYVLCEEGCDGTGPCKVGTARVVAYRVDSLRGGNPRNLVLLHEVATVSRWAAFALERRIHEAFADARLPGRDWFNAPPAQLISFLKDREPL